jgi:NhaA family Na+:H+ antiporter
MDRRPPSSDKGDLSHRSVSLPSVALGRDSAAADPSPGRASLRPGVPGSLVGGQFTDPEGQPVATRPIPSATPSFLYSERRLARFAQPLHRFQHIEAAGGIVIVAAAVVALVWANVWPAGYDAVWSTPVDLRIGSYEFSTDLQHVINDLLMALFFFVVGMEIKREMVHGELRDPRAVALPVLAALGGMIVPALIFLAFNAGGDGRDGWAIPMATDIAFAVGVLALLGSRVPAAVKIMLLTLAIVDDIAAIAVIALFYTSDVEPRFLLFAAVVVAVVVGTNRLDIANPVVPLALGLLLWLMVYESGVHATIAGVVMGLLAPAQPRQTAIEAEEVVDVIADRGDVSAADVRVAAWAIRGSVSTCDRLIDLLHPWTSYAIVPLFALANAGVDIDGRNLTSPSPLFLGVLAGLVVGKLVGITSFSWLAVRLGLGRLPTGARWGHIVGVGAVAGIGFTVSLFITGLAFDDVGLQDDAKLGTFLASIVAGLCGWAVFSRVRRGSVGVEHGVDLVGTVQGVDDADGARP